MNTAMQTIYQHEKRGIVRYTESMDEIDEFINSTQGNLIKSCSTMKPVFTPATPVKVYKMRALTIELPTLIVMINSFLHYQSSPVMLENYNYYLSAQFQRVISKFAELGPECSLYLLNTGCLYRFLRLYLHTKFESDKKLSELPLFTIEQT